VFADRRIIVYAAGVGYYRSNGNAIYVAWDSSAARARWWCIRTALPPETSAGERRLDRQRDAHVDDERTGVAARSCACRTRVHRARISARFTRATVPCAVPVAVLTEFRHYERPRNDGTCQSRGLNSSTGRRRLIAVRPFSPCAPVPTVK